MRRRRWLVVVAVAATLVVPGEAGRAEPSPGLVIEDERGDALWPLDPSLNASWADLVQTRVQTLRDDDGAARALQFTFVTAEEPSDDDEHRVFFTLGWEVYDGAGPWCSAWLTVFDGRPGGPWGEPRADLRYSCDGDDEPGSSYLDLKLIRARVHVDLDGPEASSSPERQGTAVVVTVPLTSFSQGLSAARYHEGTQLAGLSASSGVLWHFVGMGVDTAGAGRFSGRAHSYHRQLTSPRT